ncbi:phosphotransferase [Egicoccus sp. AB-alg6-2]|uniref:phosphotransferase n=1 Tax=Egicoccus sp. AB-alg6-2 TaxID=3242692 RepID=UPI00359CBB4D
MGERPTAGRDPLAAARHLEGDGALEVLREASRQAGARLVQATLRSVHHRPGRSVTHVYAATLATGDQHHEVLLVAHVDAKPLPADSFVLQQGADAVAVWRFPNDPFLPGLAPAVHYQRVRELLDTLDGPPGEVGLRTRAYRPTRRAVVEVTVTDPATTGADARASGRLLYLKVLAGRRADELAELHRQLRTTVPVPRVVGVASRQGIVAFEAMAGATLREAVVGGLPLPEPQALLELSHQFAASGLRSRRDPRAFADPTRHLDFLGRYVPGAAADLQRLAAEIVGLDAPLVPVHGDLHDGQLLLADGAVTGVLDVDGAGPGHLVTDAGNLVAHLEVIGHVWPELADRARDYAAAVAEAYRPVVGDRPLALATAGAWIALATGPHRAQDPGWETETEVRVAKALAAAR